MLISCLRCKIVYSVDDEYKKRTGEDIFFQCKLCGNVKFDVAV